MTDSKQVVYIVDDDPSVRFGLRRLMAAHGFDVRAFASAGELLSAALPSPDSCLIVDIAMPGMDGLQLQKELLRLGCRAPVIFVTALEKPDIKERARQAGAIAIFGKPVDADVLVDAVRAALAGGDPKSELGTRKAE